MPFFSLSFVLYFHFVFKNVLFSTILSCHHILSDQIDITGLSKKAIAPFNKCDLIDDSSLFSDCTLQPTP